MNFFNFNKKKKKLVFSFFNLSLYISTNFKLGTSCKHLLKLNPVNPTKFRRFLHHVQLSHQQNVASGARLVVINQPQQLAVAHPRTFPAVLLRLAEPHVEDGLAVVGRFCLQQRVQHRLVIVAPEPQVSIVLVAPPQVQNDAT